MTDLELKGMIRQLALKKASRAVDSLLRGNDTQCFTVEQYAATCSREFKYSFSAKMALVWLRLLPNLVREVRSGVWVSI